MGNSASVIASWETSINIKTQERDDLQNRLSQCLSMKKPKKILIAALYARIDILDNEICTFRLLIDRNKDHPW